MPNVILPLLQTVTRGEIGGYPFLETWGAALALILATLAIIGVLVGYGRWLEKLNGMGRRVAALETEGHAAKAERETLQRDLTETVRGFTALTKELGRHEKSTEACREDTEKLGISLGLDIHQLTHTVAAMDKTLSIELTKVQTILKERGIA